MTPGVVAVAQHAEHPLIGLVGLRVEDVVRRRRALVLSQLPEREEPVRHAPGRQQHHAAVALAHRLADQLAEQQEILGGAALVHRHADPGGRRIAEVAPDVHGPVEDRQVRVVAREDPRVVAALRLLRDQPRERRIAGDVVGDRRHAARQLVAREMPLSAFVRGHDVLERRLPVRVEHDHGVRREPVDALRPQPAEPRHQRDLLAVVDLLARLLGQHDRRNVRHETGAHHLPHRSPSLGHGAMQTFFTSA